MGVGSESALFVKCSIISLLASSRKVGSLRRLLLNLYIPLPLFMLEKEIWIDTSLGSVLK